MTDLLTPPTSRPRPARAARPPSEEPRPPSLVLAGALAALEAAALGLVVLAVVVLLLWTADARSASTAVEAVRACGAGWLLLHRVPLELAGGTLGLAPLGLAALPVVLLHRAGGQAARAVGQVGRRAAARAALSVTVPYALVGGLVAGVVSSTTVGVRAVPAMAGTALVAVAAAGLGALRAAGRGAAGRRALREPVDAALAGGVAALAALLGVGALLVGGAVVVATGRMTEIAQAVDAGRVGGAGLLLLCAALVPNAVVWALAWLAGPGFAVGTGTGVTPGEVVLGPVPALPLLGALPQPGPLPGTAWLVLALPLAAGALAAVVAVRRAARAPVPLGQRAVLAATAGCGVVAGGLAALAALLSAGPAGPGRLAEVGPSAWRVGVAVGVEVGLAAVATRLLLTHALPRVRAARG